jgi:hypothetical protein
MASLKSLADELLVKAMEPLKHDRKSLTALCLVSRRVGGIAQETLYRAIKLKSSNGMPPIILLIRNLCERPDLAQKIRSIEIHLSVYSQKSNTIGNELRDPQLPKDVLDGCWARNTFSNFFLPKLSESRFHFNYGRLLALGPHG